MNILLIGGNGFIGSHLVDCLLKKGHYIRVFDIAHERYRIPQKNVDYRISDLKNITDLYESMFGIDIIFHLASSTVPSTSNIDIISDVEKNVVSTLTILNLMIQQGIKKIVYLSSGGAVYGNPDYIPINEIHPLNPVSSYGILKATIENYIKLYSKQHNLDYLILRPSNPYGPRQSHYNAQGVISTFLRKARINEPFPVFGDGNAEKDYIYIEDFVSLAVHLVEKSISGIYNIGCGYGISLTQIIEVINIVTNKENKVIFMDNQKYDVIHFVLDVKKMNLELKSDYSATTLLDGVSKTWNWMQSIEL